MKANQVNLLKFLQGPKQFLYYRFFNADTVGTKSIAINYGKTYNASRGKMKICPCTFSRVNRIYMEHGLALVFQQYLNTCY